MPRIRRVFLVFPLLLLVAGDAIAAPVRTLDLRDRVSASPATAQARRDGYDELTVATSLQEIVNLDAPNLTLFYVTSVVDGSVQTDQLWFDRLADPGIGGGILAVARSRRCQTSTGATRSWAPPKSVLDTVHRAEFQHTAARPA
ncbi:hypothetical protein [Enhygromyxa salina]|uniref:Uncharacterized protein n=1 Tax=Enhygromyxa salina TaxID=215803 RepID=A0A2S9YVQ2_9BACT|nr:hypothetical protein [Enhygromyxa salina]PRQ09119.1 hypothetical protein ENSA7_11090 [Enhygromyxa salina]